MKFIDIEQRAPKGREFSDGPHRSSFHIQHNGLQVLGVIPHGVLIRPTTAMQRDKFVAHLEGLKFDAPESEYDKAQQTAGRDYFGPREEFIDDEC